MINNFNKLKQFLVFEKDMDYYVIKIVKRIKDNPEMICGQDVIETFRIRDLEYYERIEPEIIRLCEEYNARAHLWLEKMNSWFGLSFCKTWVVDVDPEDLSNPDFSLDKLKSDLYNIGPVGNKVIEEIPTTDGIHLICRPFDLDTYYAKYPTIHCLHAPAKTHLFSL